MMVVSQFVRSPAPPEASADAPVSGSGNFLADRKHQDPEETKLKYLISNEFAVLSDARGLSQSRIAEITGLAQPDVSRIVNGNVKDYSVWRLMRALAALGKDITITFSDARLEQGQISTAFTEIEPDDGPAVRP